jgi:hypothetical protein
METDDEKAIRLLTRQLEELQTVRGLNYKDPAYKTWRDTTTRVLQMFLGPESPHFIRFRDLRFFGPAVMVPRNVQIHPDYISPADVAAFQKACETTDASLRAAVKDIEDFGVYVEQPKPVSAGRGRGRGKSAGVSQTFNAPVTIHAQAIATDGAIQKIGHMGDTIGSSLKEIADLIQQSQDLTPRQVKEGLAGIETLAVEVQKPEAKRNWKSVLDCGVAVLEITGKATDLAHQLAPYIPAIGTLVQNAKHMLGS